jgi:hypothetical protein
VRVIIRPRRAGLRRAAQRQVVLLSAVVDIAERKEEMTA